MKKKFFTICLSFIFLMALCPAPSFAVGHYAQKNQDQDKGPDKDKEQNSDNDGSIISNVTQGSQSASTMDPSSARINILSISGNSDDLLGSGFGISYERAMSGPNSCILSLTYANGISGIAGTNNFSSSTWDASLAYRWWFYERKPLTGWFIGPLAEFLNIATTYNNTGFGPGQYDGSIEGLGLGGEVGYQWVTSGGISLNLRAGSAYSTGFGNTATTSVSNGDKGFDAIEEALVGVQNSLLTGFQIFGSLGVGYAF